MSVAIRFARFDRARTSVHPLHSAAPRRVCCTSYGELAPKDENRTPRMLTPLQAPFRALEELRNRDVPISDVLVASQARLADSMPTRRCRDTASRRRAD